MYIISWRTAAAAARKDANMRRTFYMYNEIERFRGEVYIMKKQKNKKISKYTRN